MESQNYFLEVHPKLNALGFEASLTIQKKKVKSASAEVQNQCITTDFVLAFSAVVEQSAPFFSSSLRRELSGIRSTLPIYVGKHT